MPITSENSVTSLDASAWSTLVIIAVISFFVYTFVVRPILSTDQDPATQQAQAQVQRALATANRPVPRAASGVIYQQETEETGLLMTRRPPHMLATSTSSVLVEGMLPFRNIQASSFESSKDDPEMMALNRKDRAKLLSNILTLDKTAAPPARGATVVLSIIENDVKCDKARRVVFLLATYFNLLVIILVPSTLNDSEMKDLVAELRGTDNFQVPVPVLADHRIIAAESAMGRIALVRQLGRRVEFVLDFDTEVKTELNRFGFRVMVYGNENIPKEKKTMSLLGMSLLSQ
jgi:hypothetical protein